MYTSFDGVGGGDWGCVDLQSRGKVRDRFWEVGRSIKTWGAAGFGFVFISFSTLVDNHNHHPSSLPFPGLQEACCLLYLLLFLLDMRPVHFVLAGALGLATGSPLLSTRNATCPESQSWDQVQDSVPSHCLILANLLD